MFVRRKHNKSGSTSVQVVSKIGFGAVQTSDNELFKSLVVTRLYRPGSKLKTIRYLAYFMNRYYNKDRIYRFLDNLCWRPERRQKETGNDVKYEVEQVTCHQALKVLGGAVSVVFYDTTTMYFESREDDGGDGLYDDGGAEGETDIVAAWDVEGGLLTGLDIESGLGLGDAGGRLEGDTEDYRGNRSRCPR